MKNSRHRRFYSKTTDRKSIARMEINSGMIIEFNYRDKQKRPSRPLVFVMDTNEYAQGDKKTFSGVSMNYVPPMAIEGLFKLIVKKTGFEIDDDTGFPKINLFEEEDAGLKPEIIWKPFVKEKLMRRFDCWRTYKYNNVKNVKQIKYNFQSKELKDVYDNLAGDVKQDKKPKQAEPPKKPEPPKLFPDKPKQPKRPKGGVNEDKL